MPHLHTKLSERMADKRRVKSRKFMMVLDHLANIVDVFFVGFDGEHLGEVQAMASPVGREAVEKLFPECRIHWCDDLGPGRALFPDDWKEMTFVLPRLLQDMASLGLQHNLPKELLSRRPINEFCPDQFAALMTAGANHQGVRSAMWSLGENRIVKIGDANGMSTT